MKHNASRHRDLAGPLSAQAAEAPAWLADLFDQVGDVVFFVKDEVGRYLAVNRTLVERCGAGSAADLLGRTSAEVFPAPLGQLYLEQDREVCRSGVPIVDRLELHLLSDRHEGWCLTTKIPIRNDAGTVVGVAGISRDLKTAGTDGSALAGVSSALGYLHAHFGAPLRVAQLAAVAGMSAYQLNRRIRSIFGITTRQLIVKVRLDAASRLLRTSRETVATIAASCGFFDQSAFTRQFRAAAGLTPTQYRRRAQRSGG